MTLQAPWNREETEEEEVIIQNPCKICGKELPLSSIEKDAVILCPYCSAYNNNDIVIESDPEKYDRVPDIKLRWSRFGERIRFSSKPMTILALGVKDSGKSCLLEILALRYPKIIDCYGASDFEGLSWCKPEFSKIWFSIHGAYPKILLVHGEGKDISSKFDKCSSSELTLALIESHDVVTTCEQFFAGEGEYFECMAKIIHICWKERVFWEANNIWYIMFREASNFLYSVSKTVSDDHFARSEFLKCMREARHHGLTLACDFLRYTNCCKEIRDLADLLFIKCLGATGLPPDLWYIYRYFIPYSLMQMKPHIYCLLTGRGSIGYGISDYPKWHKTEHENILKICEIEIKNVDRTIPDERNYALGSFDHTEIIKVYMDMEPKSMEKTATATARSYKTVHNHIAEHNASIKSLGECKKCFNANGEFGKVSVPVPPAGRPKKEKEIEKEKENEAEVVA
jgi:hypothetical protein